MVALSVKSQPAKSSRACIVVFSPGLDQCVRHPWLKSSAMPEHTVSVSHAIPFLVELFSRRSSIRVALEVLILKVISQRQKVEGFFLN